MSIHDRPLSRNYLVSGQAASLRATGGLVDKVRPHDQQPDEWVGVWEKKEASHLQDQFMCPRDFGGKLCWATLPHSQQQANERVRGGEKEKARLPPRLA
jgi:hypothetical protein